RHGETDWNAELRMQGHRDIPLNETGRLQAINAAPSIAALEPDVVFSSDLSRAVATAEIFAAQQELSVRCDERLRETALGQLEGLTRDDVMAGWPGQWQQWRTTSAHVSPPGGESRIEVARRAAA